MKLGCGCFALYHTIQSQDQPSASWGNEEGQSSSRTRQSPNDWYQWAVDRSSPLAFCNTAYTRQETETAAMPDYCRTTAKKLFFQRFLAHPSRVLSLFPSSPALGRIIAKQIRRADDEYVVELGAGTGSVTKAILSSGIPAEKLIAVEIDKEMAQFLRKAYPGVTVLECSAFEFERMLPHSAIGKVGCIICGIPIARYPLEQQRRLAETMLSLMPRGRAFLAFSFRLASPIPVKKLRLVCKRLAVTLRNFPPTTVWAYASDAEEACRDQVHRSAGHPPVKEDEIDSQPITL